MIVFCYFIVGVRLVLFFITFQGLSGSSFGLLVGSYKYLRRNSSFLLVNRYIGFLFALLKFDLPSLLFGLSCYIFTCGVVFFPSLLDKVYSFLRLCFTIEGLSRYIGSLSSVYDRTVTSSSP